LSAEPASVGTADTVLREVVAWAGPWPLEERWWRPMEHRRQARLQLVTADGSALLVHLQHQLWWLRAEYR
jgi:protein ImuB